MQSLHSLAINHLVTDTYKLEFKVTIQSNPNFFIGQAWQFRNYKLKFKCYEIKMINDIFGNWTEYKTNITKTAVVPKYININKCHLCVYTQQNTSD